MTATRRRDRAGIHLTIAVMTAVIELLPRLTSATARVGPCKLPRAPEPVAGKFADKIIQDIDIQARRISHCRCLK